MTETKHTPTPWIFERNPRTVATWNIIADGIRIAEVVSGPTKTHKNYFGETSFDPNDPVDGPHNAAFIVRACNAHDDLVTALNSLLADCEIMGFDKGNAGVLERMKMAKAALAKAGAQ